MKHDRDTHVTLIVEDDQATAELERRALARAGTATIVASSVKDALAVLDTHHVSAIILDYELPGGDPWDIFEAAKSKSPRIPVVVVTGQGNERIAAEALQLGAADYLKKSNAFWEELPGILGRVMQLVSAEERLRESEERFRGAFEFAAIGMALVAPDGRWLRVNHSLCRIVGYTAEELLAKDFQSMTHPDDLESDVGYVRKMVAGSLSHYDLEKRYFHKDGHIIWTLLSVSLVRNGSGVPLYFVAQIQDITGQRQLTDELRSAREDLHTILDNLPARITSWHPDSTNHFVNLVAATRFGVAADEAVGKHASEVLGPDRYARAKPHMDAALAGERRSYEHVDTWPDGSRHHSHVVFVPKLREGEVQGLYALATDVTELRQSYQRIRDLAQRVEMVREEERRSIAHTLHEGIAQDLFAVKLGLDHLRREIKDSSGASAACRDLTEAVEKCMADTRLLANDLVPTALKHFSLFEGIEDHARFFANISGLRIEVRKIDPLNDMDDASRLVIFRAAQEAMTNVARHAKASRIDVVLWSDATGFRLDVIDDGIGFDRNALSKAGSLGLLGVRERCESLGGSLVLEKHSPAGTKLSVCVPTGAAPGT